MPKSEDLGRLWGVDPAARPGRDGVIDLTPAGDPSSQVTAPFDPTRPFDPVARAREEPVDPWSARSGTLGQSRGGGATVSYPPPPVAAVPPARKSRGPGGCVLGLLAFLIIVAVGGLFAWGVAKPMVSDRVRDELDHGLATQVAGIEAPSLGTAGTVTLTEEEINREIGRYAGSYDPVKNVQVRITPDELRVGFDLYGVTSTYRGGVAVENGRIVVVDPELSGPAAQFLSAQDVAGILETQFASLMERSNVQPTAVRLRDGEITVTTKRA
ncbi:MAG TPA: hypothetical protein VKB09_06795 [Thermomicrobiales bacterium]|nr:hypothetical protein [Thermomicrobiales bacterium]